MNVVYRIILYTAQKTDVHINLGVHVKSDIYGIVSMHATVVYREIPRSFTEHQCILIGCVQFFQMDFFSYFNSLYSLQTKACLYKF